MHIFQGVLTVLLLIVIPFILGISVAFLIRKKHLLCTACVSVHLYNGVFFS